MPATAVAVAAITDAIDGVGATALVAAWGGDSHKDHVATAGLARHARALRPGLRLCGYPIWGRFPGTSAATTGRIVRFDSEPHRAAKSAAIARRRTQMTPMIDDDPQGFMMTTAMQAHFVEHPEVFLAD